MSDPEGNWPQWIKNTVKWVTKNVVKPVVKTVKNTLSKFDATFSKGSNISFAIINFSFNIQGGISIDTKGNVAIQHSTGIGSSTESLTFSATTYKSVTNAPNIEKLEGNAYQIGGSVGVPVSNIPLSAGADLSIIPDYEENKKYLGISSGVGVGMTGAEIHLESVNTMTFVDYKFNVFNIAENIYIKIMEW